MAVAVVRRQQRGDVGVDAQKVADGVLVLGAIQPVEGVDAAGIGVGGRCPIDLGLEVVDKRLRPSRVRSRPAGRRHRVRRSFRITRSQTSGSAPAFATSGVSSARLPLLSLWLWQVTQ